MKASDCSNLSLVNASTFQRWHPFRLVLLVEMAWSALWLGTVASGSGFWWLGAPLLWPVYRLLARRDHELLKMSLGVVLLFVWNGIATRYEHWTCLTGVLTREVGFRGTVVANAVAISIVLIVRLAQRLRQPVERPQTS